MTAGIFEGPCSISVDQGEERLGPEVGVATTANTHSLATHFYHVDTVPTKLGRRCRIPGVADRCEPCRCCEPKLGPLADQ